MVHSDSKAGHFYVATVQAEVYNIKGSSKQTIDGPLGMNYVLYNEDAPGERNEPAIPRNDIKYEFQCVAATQIMCSL